MWRWWSQSSHLQHHYHTSNNIDNSTPLTIQQSPVHNSIYQLVAHELAGKIKVPVYSLHPCQHVLSIVHFTRRPCGLTQLCDSSAWGKCMHILAVYSTMLQLAFIVWPSNIVYFFGVKREQGYEAPLYCYMSDQEILILRSLHFSLPPPNYSHPRQSVESIKTRNL